VKHFLRGSLKLTGIALRPGDAVSAAASNNDGDWNTLFKGAMHPTFPQYLTLAWPSPQTVGAMTLVCDWCQGQGLTNWDIQTSADGSGRYE
jgi:hypothetical protein